MLRGSRPGERRGGRKRGTPNRRTLLKDRILSIGLDHPSLSQRALLLRLVKDSKLPADTRIAVSPICFPPKRTRAGRPPALGRDRTSIAHEVVGKAGSAVAGARLSGRAPAASQAWSPDALDALFGVVQDATANPQARRKAALKIAEFLLPKTAKKPKVTPDEYGFLINWNLARAYRDIKLELRRLRRDPARKIPAVAENGKKLEARSTAILQQFEMPWGSKYDDEEANNDIERLLELAELRGDGMALTDAQQYEEAHLWVRHDVFRASPQSVARRRREALENAYRRFQESRLSGEFYAPPLSREQQNDLKLLCWLFPAPLTQPELDGVESHRDHPFVDDAEVLNVDGTVFYYPLDSKLFALCADDQRKWSEQTRKAQEYRRAREGEPEIPVRSR